MTEENMGSSAPFRDPRVKVREHHTPIVWVIPLIAIAIGITMLVHAKLQQGPTITISFDSANGLEAGKTRVRYKDVVIGTVNNVVLSQDDSHVTATVQFEKSAKRLLHADTRFWIVRPQIGTSGISGIETLLSGVYITLDPGKSSTSGESYTALVDPPMVTSGEAGRSFVLKTDDIGSINVGSPLYFRHIDVGRVASYELDKATKTVSIRIFVHAPYDQFVNGATRFWNASGVDVSLTAAGLKLQTQSLATIIAGGIAFDSAPGVSDTPEASPDTPFSLAMDRQTAMSDFDGKPLFFRMRFPEALRGLEVGAPVEFFGVNVGDVRTVALDYDPSTRKFSVVVDIALYSHRMVKVLAKLPTSHDDEQKVAVFVAALIKDGLRAQARTGNLLTGQLYIAIDYVPNPAPVSFDINSRPLVIPTTPGSLDKVQEQLGSIIAKLQKIPFDSIGKGVDHDIAELGQTLHILNTSTLPAAQNTFVSANTMLRSANGVLQPDSSLQANLNQLLLELTRMSQSFRALSDALTEHPESLIRGRSSAAPSNNKARPEVAPTGGEGR
jgi:paraquat-inducible protein B